MKTNIFSKTALDSIATPEQLDQQVKIMKPVTWLILCAVSLGFVTLAVWSIKGNITSGTSLKGIIYPNSDVLLVSANTSGIIKDLLVDDGEYVEVGDIIATVQNQNELDKIKDMNIKLSMYEMTSPEYKEYEIAVQDAKQKYIADSVIESSYSGYIQTVKKGNTIINEGDSIATIIPNDKASTYNEVIVYVSKQIAISLSCGLEAEISPEYAPREKYGYMKGIVTSISTVPVTEDSIIKHMGTLSYVSNIMPEANSVEVRIKLNLSEDSSDSYQWSNPKGEKLSIEIGTVCDIFIVTKEQKPINLLFE